MSSFSTVFTIVGGLAGIVALLLPAQGWRHRLMHVIYGLSIAILAMLASDYQSKLAAVTKIENQAAALVATADVSGSGSSRGFILASLSFLEKNKDSTPDTYKRAVQLAENCGVVANRQDDAVQRLYQGWSLQDAAGAMKQLLIGIAGGDSTRK